MLTNSIIATIILQGIYSEPLHLLFLYIERIPLKGLSETGLVWPKNHRLVSHGLCTATAIENDEKQNPSLFWGDLLVFFVLFCFLQKTGLLKYYSIPISRVLHGL